MVPRLDPTFNPARAESGGLAATSITLTAEEMRMLEPLAAAVQGIAV